MITPSYWLTAGVRKAKAGNRGRCAPRPTRQLRKQVVARHPGCRTNLSTQSVCNWSGPDPEFEGMFASPRGIPPRSFCAPLEFQKARCAFPLH